MTERLHNAIMDCADITPFRELLQTFGNGEHSDRECCELYSSFFHTLLEKRNEIWEAFYNDNDED